METKIILIIAIVGFAFLIIFGCGALYLFSEDIAPTSFDVEDLRHELDDCEGGSEGFLSTNSFYLELKVIGKTTYNGEQVCHSSGIFRDVEENEEYYLDAYLIDEDNFCFDMTPVDDPSVNLVACEGSMKK